VGANGDVALAVPNGTGAAVVTILGDQSTVVADSWDSPPTGIAFAPDGDHVVFVKRTGEIDLDRVGVPGPERMLVPSGPRGSLTVLGGWSGLKTLVYERSSFENGERHSAIYAVDTSTSTSREITAGHDPSVSPDGAKIAFVSGGGLAWGDELDTIGVDGAGRRTILVKSPITSPVWSPDSTQLAFLWTIDKNPHLDVVQADGAGAHEIGVAHAPLFWTPAGIVTHVFRVDAGPAGVVVDPASGSVRPLGHVTARGGVVPVAVGYGLVAYIVLRGDGDRLGGVRLVNSDGTNDHALEQCHGTARADRIYGSPLADEIVAGSGNDVVYVRGGGVDFVACGPGRDVVYADKRDHVYRDCERVMRR
jgi:Tol biopolymer transport system component